MNLDEFEIKSTQTIWINDLPWTLYVHIADDRCKQNGRIHFSAKSIHIRYFENEFLMREYLSHELGHAYAREYRGLYRTVDIEEMIAYVTQRAFRLSMLIKFI